MAVWGSSAPNPLSSPPVSAGPTGSALWDFIVPGTDPSAEQYVPRLVDALLLRSRELRASDIHLRPAAEEWQIDLRIDGVLQRMGSLPVELGKRCLTRLKVMASLLTYRNDIPQDGRVRTAGSSTANESSVAETRISTFPTLFGEQAVVRLFADEDRLAVLDQLGLPDDILQRLRQELQETGGVILLTGPAGSGKTTTIYASLREILNKSRGGRHLITLEDPIESVVGGVTQSQVNPQAGLDLTTGLKAILRQDPDVIMVGEIRDSAVAETVFQAALTGHLVLTTYHAGSAAAAINRLCDMGIEPYLLRSGLRLILCQRLFRRLCACARPAEARPAEDSWQAVGCGQCDGTGYRGRFLLAEALSPEHDAVGQAIVQREQTASLEQIARSAGMIALQDRAEEAIAQGLTTREEVWRVLGGRGGK